MGEISASQELHELLTQKEEGFLFTLDSLTQMSIDAGYEHTPGSLSGFINKAIRAEAVSYAGKVFKHGTEGRKVYQYRLENREPWEFKSRGKGSRKGRQISRAPNALIEDQVQELMQEHQLVFSDDTPAPVESLYMRLFDLAAEVEALEKKSLKDYTSDELINELKSRIK